MDYFLEMLNKPFLELRLWQQLLMVSVLACCLLLVSYSVLLAARRTTQRRHARRSLLKPIEITWVDAAGLKCRAQGHCLNISEGGLQMECRDL